MFKLVLELDVVAYTVTFPDTPLMLLDNSTMSADTLEHIEP